jgi:hypothetical protein
MSRHFGVTSRSALGAQPPTGSLHGHDTQPDFPRSPSSFLEPPSSLLPSPDFSTTCRDIFLMFRVAVLILVTGFAFLLLFINLH